MFDVMSANNLDMKCLGGVLGVAPRMYRHILSLIKLYLKTNT